MKLTSDLGYASPIVSFDSTRRINPFDKNLQNSNNTNTSSTSSLPTSEDLKITSKASNTFTDTKKYTTSNVNTSFSSIDRSNSVDYKYSSDYKFKDYGTENSYLPSINKTFEKPEKAWQDFSTKPLITVLNDPLYPIKDTDFPVVTLCSSNRLSKKAVLEYANELSLREESDNKNVTNIVDKLKMLSYLYSISSVDGIDDSELLSFGKLIEDFSNDVLRRLTPKCEDLIVSCEIGGETIQCDEIIKQQNSEYGDCCTFNISEKSTLNNIREDYLFRSSDTGLILVVNMSTEDYFYTLFNTQDHVIHVYTKNKYDDGSSGGIIEKFITAGEETFIGIIKRFLHSDDEVQKYGIESRRCLFPNELPKNIAPNYGLNKCLTECRINSIKVLCKCIPFYYYDEAIFSYERNSDNTIQFCTLQHVACLEKYRFKWINVVTERIKSKELEKEIEDSLYCPQCYVLCSNSQIKASVSSLPIRQSMTTSELLSDFSNFNDLAIVRVFYKEGFAKYYKQTLKNFWFEVFSTIGGICGLMTGLSLGALCKIIYFTRLGSSGFPKVKICSFRPVVVSPEIFLYHPLEVAPTPQEAAWYFLYDE
ncbi:sodium channel protein Nach [Condylostylus longicornis]|uniref:sodium channel protein Nach n=1 Tax=Condylostylus longicornis TaxID=2530218 RepID=UPI00244E0D63|nr:sodium channel protein Nach [Condylostylus longicornis]